MLPYVTATEASQCDATMKTRKFLIVVYRKRLKYLFPPLMRKENDAHSSGTSQITARSVVATTNTAALSEKSAASGDDAKVK